MSAAERKTEFEVDDLQCSITGQLFLNPVTLSCNDIHVFEEEAIVKHAQEGIQNTCPLCRAPLAYYKENTERKVAVESYIKDDEASRRSEQYKLGGHKLRQPIRKQVKHKPGQAKGEVWYDFSVYAEAAQQSRAGRTWLERLHRLIFLILLFAFFILFLVSVSFGIYLALLLMPVIVGALLTLGIAPVVAWILGVLGSLALIFATWDLLVPGGFLSQIFLNGITKKRGWAFWYFLAFLTGIGFGIYLSVLVGPLVGAALVAAGISSGLSGFIVVAMSLLLIRATVDWLDLLVSYFGIKVVVNFNHDNQEQFLNALPLPVVLFEAWQTLKFTWKRDHWLGLGYGLGWCAGLALSIYLCVLVAPLIVNALVLAGVSWGVGTCLLAIIGLALATALVRIIPILLSLPIYLGRYAFFSAKRNLVGKSMLSHGIRAIVIPWQISLENLTQSQGAEPSQRVPAHNAEEPRSLTGMQNGVHGPLPAADIIAFLQVLPSSSVEGQVEQDAQFALQLSEQINGLSP